MPAAALRTAKDTVHEPLAASVPAVSETVVAPARTAVGVQRAQPAPLGAAVTVPPQDDVPLGAALLTSPAGYVSARPTFASATGVALLIATVRTLVPPTVTDAGVKDFVIVGGGLSTTTSSFVVD